MSSHVDKSTDSLLDELARPSGAASHDRLLIANRGQKPTQVFSRKRSRFTVRASLRPMSGVQKIVAVIITTIMIITGALIVRTTLWKSDEGSPSPSLSGESILFIGDSITNSYNSDDGDIREGWWSLLADEINLTPVTSSQGASGILRRGTLNDEVCRGTTFKERIPEIRDASPKIVVIEVGRNDWRVCDGDGFRPSTPKELKFAAEDYFSSVSRAVDQIGLTPYDVYVITPWGTDKLEEQEWIQPIIKSSAEAQGFHYIDTNNLPKDMLLDKSHPNYRGNRELVRQIDKNSNLIKRFNGEHGRL